MTQVIVCKSEQFLEWLEDHFNHSQKLMNNIRRMAAVDWIKNGSFIWNDKFDVPLAQMMTRRGIGFTFNSLQADDFFYLQK